MVQYLEGVSWQGSAPPIKSAGEWRAARLSPQGHSINKDWIDQMIDDGLVFGMEWGTENAPVAWTAVIDDVLCWGVVTNPAGRVMIPLYCEINIATWSTSTLVEAMLEADTIDRYASAGTVQVPKNLRTDVAGSNSGMTSVFAAPADVVANAKSDSREFARHVFSEDNIGTAVGADMVPFVFNRRLQPGPVIKGLGSVVIHLGGSADGTAYGRFIWAEMTEAQYENV